MVLNKATFGQLKVLSDAVCGWHSCALGIHFVYPETDQNREWRTQEMLQTVWSGLYQTSVGAVNVKGRDLKGR